MGDEEISDVDRIQSAQEEVAQLQDALVTLQQGLERAEEVAVVADRVKARSEKIMMVTLGLLGLTVIVVLWSRRRRS